MKKQNKYLYGYKLTVNYGYGWEYEVLEKTGKEIRQQVKAYRENCSYPIRITKGREPNPNYKE